MAQRFSGFFLFLSLRWFVVIWPRLTHFIGVKKGHCPKGVYWRVDRRSLRSRIETVLRLLRINPSVQAVHLSDFITIWIFIYQTILWIMDCNVWNSRRRRHPRSMHCRFAPADPSEQIRCSIVFCRRCRWFRRAMWCLSRNIHAVQGDTINDNMKSL